MKILNITSGIWSMGPGRGMPSLFNVQREFARAGHRVIILAPRPAWVPADQAGEEAEGMRIEYVNVPLWDTPLPRSFIHTRLRRFAFFHLKWLFFVIAMYRAGLREARTQGPDVLYGHDPHGVPVAYLLGRRLRRPNVTRLYGSILYPFLRDRRWTSLVGHFDDILGFLLPASLYIVTDDGTRGDAVARALGVDESRFHFLMNGVEPAPGQAPADRQGVLKAYGLPPDGHIVLSLNRLDWWKRVDRLVDAAPQVSRGTTPATILVVGDGPERPSLEARVQALGMGHVVRFLGSVDRSAVAALLSVCDLFVGVSDLSNLGNNLLEAMVHGCAILATDSGDTRRVIVDGKTGRLLAEGRAGDLGKEIVALLLDDAERQRLGGGARAFAKEHFATWEERGRREVALVENLVALGPPRARTPRGGPPL